MAEILAQTAQQTVEHAPALDVEILVRITWDADDVASLRQLGHFRAIAVIDD